MTNIPAQKTTRSEELFARAKRVAPGGVHSPVRGFRGVGGTPRFIEWAKGAEMVDVDGNHYLDFCMSWGPLIFGHQDEDIAQAVRQALTRGWSYGAAEPYSLELAELLTQKLPWLQKIRFVNSGTEAVMSALRVARGATSRSKIIKFDGCYHGHVDSMLVRAGSGLAEMASPDSAGVSQATASETLVCPLNDLEALARIFESHSGQVAGVIIEPLPANNGLLLQTDDFLRGVAALCKRHGALLIFDEVISGFRAAFGGMAELTGITPDLVTYGKIIGGGFPVGAYGGRADLMDWVAPAGPVYQAGTLSANPVAMAAGLAMIKKLISANPYPKLFGETRSFGSALEAVGKKRGVPITVQSFASIAWVLIGEIQTPDGVVRTPSQIPSTQKEHFAKLFHALLKRGVYLAPSGFEVSFLATVHTQSILECTVGAFDSALQEITAQ